MARCYAHIKPTSSVLKFISVLILSSMECKNGSVTAGEGAERNEGEAAGFSGTAPSVGKRAPRRSAWIRACKRVVGQQLNFRLVGILELGVSLLAYLGRVQA